MKKTLAMLAMVGVSALFAAEHEVKMLNKGADGIMVFEPAYVKAAAGDTITFVATDPTHNVKSVLVPDGASSFQSPGGTVKKGEKYSVKLDKEGVYVYECVPHTPMGMVGLIQVGKAVNADKVNDGLFKPAKAKERFNKYAAQIQK
ncbi:pseudoazurin [Campylobacter sp. MIT 12-8780]|uniref:pseudoazurin n=1 Tax=unclassified Campylobacter TaxID=2593542 RepID=UPI0010F4D163|nr:MULTISPECIES: pseudoazurin [unclassified Campylobacter]NDJ26665.1 pseudoazurin [Campylobacter sp. MIT 19-121]TKX30258.1 pseudoazurin [Campylobacter sp. MIT 12-5580]TQR42506.1 pseudoazurin [Campylobacter sp. MIT 12-8780]